MRARGGLLGAIVHRLLIDLLRGLSLIGIGDLIGALGLRVKCDRNVERKLVHVRHRLDLGFDGVGQRRIRRRDAIAPATSARCRGLANAPRSMR